MRTVRIGHVEADSTKKVRETEDAIVVPTIFTRESILPFADGKGYRPAKELKDAAWTLENSWVVAFNHIDTVFVTDRADIKGKAENVKFCPKINGLIGDTKFFKSQCDKAFLAGVKKGNLKDVSVAYFSEDDFTPGKFGDEAYDFVQRNFMFGHVAAGVPEGRCPSPFCGMAVDSLFAKHGDPEVTENYVRIRVRDPGLFVEGSLRTIVLSADQGIHAIIGKLKSDPNGSTVIQNYMFEVAKDWTMEKGQAWVAKHKDAAGSTGSMTTEEIKAKMGTLIKQRDEIMYRLYPKTALSEEEQQNARIEMSLLDAEINALTNDLAENLTAGDRADAEWTTEYINDLPDSSFAFIEEGGKKDDQGKTVPRSLRHLPFKDAEGSIDHDHLVNGLARVKQSGTMPEGGKSSAIEKLCAAVGSWNKDNADKKIESDVCGTTSEGDSCRVVLDPAGEVERSRTLLNSR
jgi:hypothetical protein